MPNFWENDPIASGPQGGAPAPIFTVPDPQRDLENTRKVEADAREAERLRMSQAEAERSALKFRQEQEERAIRGGPATTESEKTAAFLATRVANGIRTLRGLSGRADSPEWDAEAARVVLGDTAANFFTSEDRQRVEAAQRDILDAALTLGTGAAYTAEQLEGYRRSYFPQLGDNPNTISDKRQRLDALLESAKVKAGAAAPAIDEALRAATGGEGGAVVADTAGFDRNRAIADLYGIDETQERVILDFWNSQRGNASLTPEQVRAFYQQNGLPAPDEASIAQAIAEARKGQGFNPLSTDELRTAWEQRVSARADDYEGKVGEYGAADLATQGLTAGLSDEAAGIGTAIGSALRGDLDLAENYRLGKATETELLDRARNRTGTAGTAVELLGNAASLGAGSIASIPASTRIAVREGAIAGAVPGFGYGEGLEGSAAGAAVGGLAGGTIARLFNRRGGTPRPPRDGARVVQAADELNQQYGSNIRPLPADVAGATTRRATGATAQMPLGAGPIINAASRVTDEAQTARDAIARSVGEPQEIEAAGQQALQGAQTFMQRSRARVNSLYNRARNAGGDVRVPLENARRVLDEHIAELEQTPGGARGLADLRALRDEISENHTVEGIKRMRTQLRDAFATDGLRGSDLERRAMLVVDAAEDDIVTGLTRAGRPEAATAYREAAEAYRERVTMIDNVLAPIIGRKGDDPRSGEQIMAAIRRMSKGDNAKLARFMDALPADEAGTVRATIIGNLGRATDGAQNAAGDAFSLPRFLTEWNALTPGAKRTLFGGEERAALDNLARVAEGTQEAQRFANFSNTGSANALVATTGVGVAGFSTAPIATTALIASQYGLGRLLASPRFARWLARMPANPRAVPRHLDGLGKIAAVEAPIAADALGLQRALMEQFAGPMKLAAESDPQATTATTGQETR